MKPTYVRFVVPSNKDVKCNISASNTINFRTPQPITLNENTTSSLQLLNGTLPTVLSPKACIITNSPSSTFNMPKPIIIQKTNNLPTLSSTSQIHSNSSVSIPQASSTKSNIITMIPNTAIGNAHPSGMQPAIVPSTIKRSCSPSSGTVEKPIKQSKKFKSEEPGTKVGKRRQWNENETFTFINVWIDHYTNLTDGSSRHTTIYNEMAAELNNILNRRLTGAEVKTKITNLTTQYKLKKAEQGRTGASPSPWPYYNLIDKLIGERAYLDDTLLTDSIKIKSEDEQREENEDLSSAPGLNSTQISEQVTDVTELTISDDINDPASANGTSAPSSSVVIPVDKSDGSVQIRSKSKKNARSKKKRPSEAKMDLMENLFDKIETASEAAAQSEIKILELLEKQTRLQEESMNNEREFLNVFKTIANNMNGNR